ncbi:aspartyl protease family protein [candidate division WOR-3 bacterium]|nr:aspartyl protease family protein [candidate division WOR-3 bacterium]
MRSRKSMLLGLLALGGLIILGHSEELLSDPHQILEKHFEAVGGLDNLQAQRTVYQEGMIRIEGAGLEGTFKQWSERPLKLRQELDLHVVKTTSGDNGDFSWEVDANGKVLIKRDENTLKEREVRRLMEEYAHLYPGSESFTLTFEGVEKCSGTDCYVVKIANTINQNVRVDFYDSSTFYLLRTLMIKPDGEQHVDHSDFRRVDGIVVAFRESIRTLPVDQITMIELSRYEMNIGVDPGIFEHPAQDVEDFVFLDGDRAENIPFDYIEEHIYLPVNLCGKERLWVLDCGASVNVIDSSFAAQLGLAFEGPIKGQGASGVVDFYFVTLPSYEVGTIRFNEQKAVALNFVELFRRSMGLEVVGILGYDFLSRFVTRIDYAQSTVSFYHPGRFEYEGDGIILDSPLLYNMLNLPAVVDGKYSGRWRVDVGADGIDFHYPFAEAHGLSNRKGVDFMAGDAAGLTTQRISRYKTIEIGDFVLRDPLIGIALVEGTGSFAEETTIGNIGNSLLRNFVVYLDYKAQRVILEKGDDFGKEFPAAKSGLQFMYNAGQDIEVLFVSSNTPAHDAGFEKGDIIRSVNGIGVEYLDGIIALRRLMRAEVGTTYTVEVLRDRRAKKLKLTLRELF